MPEIGHDPAGGLPQAFVIWTVLVVRPGLKVDPPHARIADGRHDAA